MKLSKREKWIDALVDKPKEVVASRILAILEDRDERLAQLEETEVYVSRELAYTYDRIRQLEEALQFKDEHWSAMEDKVAQLEADSDAWKTLYYEQCNVHSVVCKKLEALMGVIRANDLEWAFALAEVDDDTGQV